MNAALLIGIFLLVAALCASAITLLRDVTTQPLTERLTAVRMMDRHRRPTVGSIRRAQVNQAPWAIRLFRLIGFDRENRNQYPIPWPAVAVAAIAAAGAGYWFAAGLAGRFVGAPAGVAAGFLCARMLFLYQRRRYADRLLRQLPDAIGLIVRGAGVGIPVAEATQTIARESPEPIAGEFSRVAREVAVGAQLETAIGDIYHRTGLPEFSFLAVTIGLQQRSGGSSSTALSNLADIVRKRIAMASRAKALSGEARVSILILSILPFAAGSLLALSNWSYMQLLFTTPTGAILQKVFLGLFTSGLLAMRWLMKQAVRG